MPRYFINVFLSFKCENAEVWRIYITLMFELMELKFRDSVQYAGNYLICDICPGIKISRLLHTLTEHR